jgi:hypothetical protein
MDVKLRDIFTGRARWCWKPEQHGIVDACTAPVSQQRPCRQPRCRDFPRKLLDSKTGLGSGHPDDRNRARRPP